MLTKVFMTAMNQNKLFEINNNKIAINEKRLYIYIYKSVH